MTEMRWMDANRVAEAQAILYAAIKGRRRRGRRYYPKTVVRRAQEDVPGLTLFELRAAWYATRARDHGGYADHLNGKCTCLMSRFDGVVTGWWGFCPHFAERALPDPDIGNLAVANKLKAPATAGGSAAADFTAINEE